MQQTWQELSINSCTVKMLTMIPLSMVFWNRSRTGHNFLLSSTCSCSGSSALVHLPLKRASTLLSMLSASRTMAAKGGISHHCRNRNKERACKRQGVPGVIPEACRPRYFYNITEMWDLIFQQSVSYSLFCLFSCFLFNTNLLRSVETDLLPKSICANLPLFVVIYV